ncbi:MAG: hypothetical protein ACXVAX_08470, partial [Pseudobdellovibrio sp.]
LPYQITLKHLQFIAKTFWSVDLWPRHSYVLGSFVAGRSDLDLTLYSEDSSRLKGFLNVYGLYKKIIPFLGEVAAYTPELLNYLKEFDLNGFELERDPLLIAKFDLQIKNNVNFSKEKASVYLLLAIINDFHNLKKNPESRLKKWNQHFSHLKSSLIAGEEIKNNLHLSDTMTLFSLFSALVVLNPGSNPLLRTQLLFYVELAIDSEMENRDRWLRPLISDNQSHLYPFFTEYICHIEAARPQVSAGELNLICAQIDWFLLKTLKQTHEPKSIAEDIERILIIQKDLKFFSKQHSQIDVTSTDHKIERALSILQRRI